MNREEKKELIAELSGLFGSTTTCIVTHYKGMTVAEVEKLRREMRAAGASFRVTKNRITRLALEGTSFEGIAPLFVGPTAIATSVDPVAAAKVCVEYAKKNDKLVILGGSMQGKLLDTQAIDALAKLPSLDELRGKLLGMINTPATRIAGVLQAPAGQLARVFNAYATKDEAA
ncbi:50S ribosomal protein L10 [Pararhodospirillum photometricum]|uniref:Large ribosomal subunit protein uL10 n=1 Tax=Pararhodospirillum photometricum DSM 122 TaxID=1150469 RepID=H6SIL4_PARPM|nr:50S ribosomal protein L10 [Pararhodospirillum photometricum]CCG06641.1 50S ribosomal protein L10 [Pararhodospirillum photometricum DSM 122]